jgi:hypothetical protein
VNALFTTWTVYVYNQHLDKRDGTCQNRPLAYTRSQGTTLTPCIHRVGAYSRAEALRAALNEHRFMTCRKDDRSCHVCHPSKAATA